METVNTKSGLAQAHPPKLGLIEANHTWPRRATIQIKKSDDTGPGRRWYGARKATIRGQEMRRYGARRIATTGLGEQQHEARRYGARRTTTIRGQKDSDDRGVRRRATIRCQEKRPYGATKSDNTEPEKQQYEARRGDPSQYISF